MRKHSALQRDPRDVEAEEKVDGEDNEGETYIQEEDEAEQPANKRQKGDSEDEEINSDDY